MKENSSLSDRVSSSDEYSTVAARRIPLRCLGCGNAMLIDCQLDEMKARGIESITCNLCDTGGNKGDELFYVGPDGKSHDFGEWMDFIGETP